MDRWVVLPDKLGGSVPGRVIDRGVSWTWEVPHSIQAGEATVVVMGADRTTTASFLVEELTIDERERLITHNSDIDATLGVQ